MNEDFEYRPGIFLINGYDLDGSITDEDGLLNLIDEIQAWHGVPITARLAYQHLQWVMK
jgi:hypothetical protein